MAKVTFHKFIQDYQELGSQNVDDDFMTSRVFFTLEVEGKKFEDMYAEVKQPYGTNYEKEPVEVSAPIGSYRGHWSHTRFAEAVERYYRDLIGSQGRAIRIGAGSRVHMVNNVIVQERTIELELPGDSGGW